MTMSPRPKRNPEIQSTVLPDGYVVLTGKDFNWAFTLTPIGAIVWAFCDGSNTVDDILERLLTFEPVQSTPQLKNEISSLLEELEVSGLFLEI